MVLVWTASASVFKIILKILIILAHIASDSIFSSFLVSTAAALVSKMRLRPMLRRLH